MGKGVYRTLYVCAALSCSFQSHFVQKCETVIDLPEYWTFIGELCLLQERSSLASVSSFGRTNTLPGVGVESAFESCDLNLELTLSCALLKNDCLSSCGEKEKDARK